MFRKLSNPRFCIYNTSSNSDVEERYDLEWGNLFEASINQRCELLSRDLKNREFVVEYVCPSPKTWHTTSEDITILFVNRISREGVKILCNFIEEIPMNIEKEWKNYIEGKKVRVRYNNYHERLCPVCCKYIEMQDSKAKIFNNRTVIHSKCVKNFSNVISEIFDEKHETFLVSGSI